jgi:hypothetical protein
MTKTPSSTVADEDERARNRFAARRATAAACGVAIAEIQALTNGYAEGVAHRRNEHARAEAQETADPR